MVSAWLAGQPGLQTESSVDLSLRAIAPVTTPVTVKAAPEMARVQPTVLCQLDVDAAGGGGSGAGGGGAIGFALMGAMFTSTSARARSGRSTSTAPWSPWLPRTSMWWWPGSSGRSTAAI